MFIDSLYNNKAKISIYMVIRSGILGTVLLYPPSSRMGRQIRAETMGVMIAFAICHPISVDFFYTQYTKKIKFCILSRTFLIIIIL